MPGGYIQETQGRGGNSSSNARAINQIGGHVKDKDELIPKDLHLRERHAYTGLIVLLCFSVSAQSQRQWEAGDPSPVLS